MQINEIGELGDCEVKQRRRGEGYFQGKEGGPLGRLVCWETFGIEERQRGQERRIDEEADIEAHDCWSRTDFGT